jgi:hypothetical protein
MRSNLSRTEVKGIYHARPGLSVIYGDDYVTVVDAINPENSWVSHNLHQFRYDGHEELIRRASEPSNNIALVACGMSRPGVLQAVCSGEICEFHHEDILSLSESGVIHDIVCLSKMAVPHEWD